MSQPSSWRMSLGPASVLISTPLSLDAGAAELRSRGEPPMYDLARLPGAMPDGRAAASLVHDATAGPPGAVWDSARASLLVQAANGEVSAEVLLYLACLVLENRLQHSGYVTLSAAAACWQDRSVLLLGTGRTTTLLRLCRDHGAAMVANDLVVVGGPGQVPVALAGTRHVRLRHASAARLMPELLGLFPGDVTDSWRATRTLQPTRLGIVPAHWPVPVVATMFVHVDPRYRELVYEGGDTLGHRLNLYENAVRLIRGGNVPWLTGTRFGPYVPPLDDPAAHAGRTGTLERLLERSVYVAGPSASVAEHIAALVTCAIFPMATNSRDEEEHSGAGR